MQLGAVHLCKSLLTHDSRKGKVLTYCGTSIHAVMAQWMFAQIKWAEARKPLREDSLVQDDSFLEEAVYHSECRETIAKLMKHLTYRERLIVKRRCEEDTLEEVAREVGVTKERIRQIEARAHGRMRDAAIKYGIVCPY
jgi:RNA polymerase sigma factor (sigma-70 family)